MRPIFFLFVLLFFAPPAAANAIYASRVIRAGEIIAHGDVEQHTDESPGAAQSLAEVVGAEARVTLYANRPIRRDQIGPPTLVTRNQPVAIIFVRSGLHIEVEGRAMDRGSVGETIRVMNLGSRRTVSGLVRHDGNILVGGEK